MVIGLLTAALSIPGARSLKDKRSVIRSLKDRTTARMNVSVAEIGAQDSWKSAELAFVTVAAGKALVEKRIAAISEVVRSNPRYVLISLHTEYL